MRVSAAIILLALASGTQAALVGRLPLTSGGIDYQAYYDTVLDVTWLADANLAASRNFGVSGVMPDGSMSHAVAGTWIAAMNAANGSSGYLGRTDWRLPHIGPVDGVALNFNVAYDGSTDYGWNIGAPGSAFPGATGSELAYLYYNDLGNLGFCAPDSIYPACNVQPGWGLTFALPFANVKALAYWSNTDFGPDNGLAGDVDFHSGVQSWDGKNYANFVWPVRSGDIVPPTAVDDLASVASGMPVNIPVLANDSGFSAAASLGLQVAPSHGTATLVPASGASTLPTITYTSTPGFAGTDSFEYIAHLGPESATATVTVTVIHDADGDGLADEVDNCINVANADQRDTDGDGYGNACDADLNNDGNVNFGDLAIFRQRFGTTNPDADFNGDGRVNFADLAIFRSRFGKAPGPSGLHP